MSYLSLITMFLLDGGNVMLFILLLILAIASIIIYIIQIDFFSNLTTKEKISSTFFCSLFPILFITLILNCVNGNQNTEYYFQKILKSGSQDDLKTNLTLIKEAIDKNFSIPDGSIKILENDKTITDFDVNETIVKIINIKQNKDMVLAHIYLINTEGNFYEKDAVLKPDVFHKIERNLYVTDHDVHEQLHKIKLSSQHDIIENNIFDHKDILFNHVKKLIEEK